MTSTYGWAVTYDHLDHKRDWITGPCDITPELTATLTAAAKAGRGHADKFPDVEWFRIYDDDGELYYTGLRTQTPDHDGFDDGFEPLDDYGTPNAGATEIRYLKVGSLPEEWETL